MTGMKYLSLFLVTLVVSAAGLVLPQEDRARPDERRLKNVQQLTFGGENAEAYFSPKEDKLIFQSTRTPHECDQMFTMNVDGSDKKLVFASNRNAKEEGETNIFIADWIP